MINLPNFNFFDGIPIKLKDRNGSIFAAIEYELPGTERKTFLGYEAEEIGIELEHWKTEDNKYNSQWIIFEAQKEARTSGEPTISEVPIYEEDFNRDERLKKVIVAEYDEFDATNIDIFLSEITQHLNNYPKIKNQLFWKDNTKGENTAGNDNEVDKFQPIHPTTHLKCFDDLVNATGLKGDEYNSIMKPVWYNIVSLLIAKIELQLGSIIVDGRIHILIFLPSGNGKTEIKKTIQRILKKLPKSYIEPTSFHPEQFVGKVVVEKRNDERDYRKLPGHLSLDYVIIDEGKDLLTSKDALYSESRKYLRLAMDQYPNNTITKKSVDIEHEHALSYEPHCGLCIFCQPFSMNEEFVLAGDLRRLILSYILMVGIDKSKSYEERVREKRNYEDSIDEFCNFLSSIEIPDKFELTEKAIDIYIELHGLLVKRGSSRSIKIKNFMKMADFSLQNMLLKFSTIQALQDGTGRIEPQHVELAFVDYVEILEHTYDYIEKKISGNLDYGENWNGAEKKDQEIIKWLYEEGATSRENSKVSIKEYKKKIMEVYGVEDRQARRKKEKHEKNGWIESKTIQHTSKVWLKFEPGDELPSEVSRDRVDKDFKDKYMEIIQKNK